MIYELDINKKIIGRYQREQEGKTLLQETHPDVVSALAYEAQLEQDIATAEQAYSYASARAKDYVSEFSKAPQPSQIDAIGHVLDAILEHLSGQSIDTAELSAILTKRAAIKARHPKG